MNFKIYDADKVNQLKKIKKEYATPRKTIIKDEITEIKIDTKDLITKEPLKWMYYEDYLINNCI